MTTPYVTGTVSVTAGSAIVTGAGTGWQTAGLVAGVFGLDSANGNPIPVLSVDSDTQITLAKPWRGTTASGQAYWITYDTTPGQQTVANAQMLALYLSRLDKPALAAFASLVPAADKLPYFGANGAGALADFNAAARALLAGGVLDNAQVPVRLRQLGQSVTAANGLDNLLENGFATVSSSAFVATVNGPPGAAAGVVLTLLSTNTTTGVQMYWNQSGNDRGWTRRRASSVWGPWQLVSLPILGTVSQSAGIPTGSIMERGTNANGEYVRFADGTQICWSPALTVSMNLAAGSVFWSNSFTQNYPVSFVGQPVGSGAMLSTINGWVNPRCTDTAWVGAAFTYSSRSSDTIVLSAIGRWF